MCLCRERLAHKEFFLEGELEGELPTPPEYPTVGVKWNRVQGQSSIAGFRMPAVMGTVWRDATGKRRCVCLVNISGQEQTYSYRLGDTEKTVRLPPRSVQTIEVRE